jgi:hypothetical protein
MIMPCPRLVVIKSSQLYLEEKKKRITEALTEACQSMRVDDLEIITSIDGMKDITRPIIIGCTVTIAFTANNAS